MKIKKRSEMTKNNLVIVFAIHTAAQKLGGLSESEIEKKLKEFNNLGSFGLTLNDFTDRFEGIVSDIMSAAIAEDGSRIE